MTWMLPASGRLVLEQMRAKLLSIGWSGTLPTAGADTTESNPAGESYSGISEVVKLVFNLPYGSTGQARWFKPATAWNGRLMLLHGGHGQDCRATPMTDWQAYFSTRGYHVVSASMPNLAPGPTTLSVTLPVTGAQTIASHAEFSKFDTAGVSPLPYYLDPIIRGLNHVLAALPSAPTVIGASGLSGGGWSFDIVGAVDTRIGRIYPVAGSLPHDIHQAGDAGDYEQVISQPWYQQVPTRFLYALGAYPSRRHRKILNKFDTCCFQASGRETALEGMAIEVRRLLDNAGEFSLRVDGTHAAAHIISDDSLDFIHGDMGT